MHNDAHLRRLRFEPMEGRIMLASGIAVDFADVEFEVSQDTLPAGLESDDQTPGVTSKNEVNIPDQGSILIGGIKRLDHGHAGAERCSPQAVDQLMSDLGGEDDHGLLAAALPDATPLPQNAPEWDDGWWMLDFSG